MLILKSLTIKNFQSVGNVSQGLNFSGDDLILVLGENLDQGGNDSKNGVGKSSILNALCYALYGTAISNIKKDNLINKINGKNMLVSLEFENNGINYKVERGRKPNILKFVVNDIVHGGEELDEARGEMKDTQVEINQAIGVSYELFKHVIALNTTTVPFLSLKSNEQRYLIEELFGITKLSEKAEVLKEQVRITKDSIKEEEFSLKSIQSSNEKIQQNIASLLVKSAAWDNSKSSKINKTQKEIESVINLDIDEEIENHNHNKEVESEERVISELYKDISSIEKEIKLYNKNLSLLKSNLCNTNESLCPTCHQEMDKETHRQVHDKIEKDIKETEDKLSEKQSKVDTLKETLHNKTLRDKKCVHYDNINEAYNHKSLVDNLASQLERDLNSENPFTEQIDLLKNEGLQEVSYESLNELCTLRDHQELLHKLLTNKDSFIRKKIIDQNLAYLNDRLTHYLEKMGLPHKVLFKSDLDVEITELGRDYDFDNLSRGEKTRLILSISWAFRDVYESLNGRINLLFVDELIDNGLDTSGVENALHIFKTMTREYKRNVYLISHRDELIGRVSSVLKVIKESGFTSFDFEETNLV